MLCGYERRPAAEIPAGSKILGTSSPTGVYRTGPAVAMVCATQTPGKTRGTMMSRPGYWPSAWPVECGDNHRPKTVEGAGLDLQPTDHLVATTRHTGRWPVMFVQRNVGELYLQGTTTGDEPEAVGWVERVDPVTLEPLARSGDLAAGGHEWCGSVAVHANGDLYTVNGSYLHRLGPDCSVKGEVALPVDHAHNGLLILDDGSILTKDIRLGDVPSTLTILDPDLRVRTSVELPEASMGRLAVTTGMGSSGRNDDWTAGGTGNDECLIYAPGATRIFRYRWDGTSLEQDHSWSPSYRAAGGGRAWDTTINNGRAWLMDNGDIPGIRARFSQIPTRRTSPAAPALPLTTPTDWTGPVTALGISVDDPNDVIRVVPTEHPSGWVIAPPLVHGNTVVAWDTGNMGIAAFDISDGRTGEMLWFQPFRPSMQPILYPDTQELVINDFLVLADNETSDDLVVLDLRTGRMKARVPTGGTRLNGMFLCPGWDRDLYYCTAGTVARIRVEPLASSQVGWHWPGDRAAAEPRHRPTLGGLRRRSPDEE